MKKGMLALLITPMVLLSLVGCGGQKGDSTSSSTSSSPVSSSVSTPVSSSTSVAAVEMGVGDALKAAVGTKVSVSGRVLAVTQQHLVIGDTTGIMLAYLGADYTITNSVDDHVKIEGVLTSFNNRNQFDSTCTIETLTTDAPVVDKTVTPWGVTEVDKFVADGTGYGSLVSITGVVTVTSTGYYNLTLVGTSNVISLAYLHSSLAEKITSGSTYTITGYAINTSGKTTTYVNIYTTDVVEATPVDPGEDKVLTVSEALAAGANASVRVDAKVVYVSSKSFLIGDSTGKMVVWLNKAPSVSVGDHVQVSGVLAERYGNLQFGDKATYEIVIGEAPDVGEDAVVAWDAAKVDEFVAKAEKERGLGYHVSLTGKLDITQSGTNTNYNLSLDGTENKISMNYMPADIAANFETNKNYTVTGYVTDVSVSSVTNYLNILVESGEEVAYSAVESISIAEDSKTLVVGSSAVIEAKVLPVMADGSVTWESLNPDIVSVEDGVVKAIKAGTATVKATSVGLTSASVTVSDTIEITVSDALATQSETYTWVTSDPKLEAKEDGVYAIGMDHFELLWLPSTKATNIATAEMRLYKNATLKISSKAGEKIAKIVIHTTGAAQYTVSCVASGLALDGSKISTIVEDMDKSAKTLTYDVAGAGYASSVSIKTANGQIRISSIEVFYA